jgi:hypothetical protein
MTREIEAYLALSLERPVRQSGNPISIDNLGTA